MSATDRWPNSLLYEHWLATVILPDERISRILTEDIVRDYYFATTNLHIYEYYLALTALEMSEMYDMTFKKVV